MKLVGRCLPLLRRSRAQTPKTTVKNHTIHSQRRPSTSSICSVTSESLELSYRLLTRSQITEPKPRKTVQFDESSNNVFEFEKVSREERENVWHSHIDLFWYRREFQHMVQEMRKSQSTMKINPLQRTYLDFCKAESTDEARHMVFSSDVHISETTLGTERCMLGETERKERRRQLVNDVQSVYNAAYLSDSERDEELRKISRSHTRAAVLFAYFVAERASRIRWMRCERQTP